MTHATYGEERVLASTTQVFKSGEIWGINAYMLRPRTGFPNLVPTQAFETRIRQSLQRYLAAARAHFGYKSEIVVECGLVNVSGFGLTTPDGYNPGPIYENVKTTAIIDTENPDSITVALLTIFNALHESAGVIRPESQYGFPPKNYRRLE
jgi:hypothetical protein